MRRRRQPLDSRDKSMLAALCWCGNAMYLVPRAMVLACDAPVCGSPRCRRSAEKHRPVLSNSR